MFGGRAVQNARKRPTSEEVGRCCVLRIWCSVIVTRGARMLRRLRRRVADWITQPDDAEWSPVSMPMTAADEQRIINLAADEYRAADRQVSEAWRQRRTPRLERRAHEAWVRHERLALQFGICVMPGCGRPTDNEVCAQHDAYGPSPREH